MKRNYNNRVRPPSQTKQQKESYAYDVLPEANPLQPQIKKKLNSIFQFVGQSPTLEHGLEAQNIELEKQSKEDEEQFARHLLQCKNNSIHDIGTSLKDIFKNPIYQAYEQLDTSHDNYYFASLKIDLAKQQKLSPASAFFDLQQQQINSKLPLIFESRFQSGNLAFAAIDSTNETIYNLALQRDTNSKATTQWYYFSIQNKENIGVYTFNIINLTKSYSAYENGMKPCVLSLNQSLIGKGWKRQGQDISYRQNTLPYIRKRKYYTLQFSYTFAEKNDKIYFAYCYPYTFSILQEFLHRKELANSAIMKSKVLTKTSGGNPIQLITITSSQKNNEKEDQTDQSIQIQKDNKKAKDEKKRMIFISARVHPGETVSSFVCQGLIQFLLGKSPQAQNIRKHYTIKIVPMLNPDGVIHGNYRTSLAGVDLNRNWKKPDKQIHCQIHAVKKYLLQSNYINSLFIDLHGHSKKRSSFMYGCLNKQNPYLCKQFPFILSKNGYHFSYYNCNFKTSEKKQGTSRITVWKQLKVDYSYTMQMSFCGPSKLKSHFSIQDYLKIGRQLGKNISTYFCGKIIGLKSSILSQNLEEFYRNQKILGYGEESSDGSESGEQQIFNDQMIEKQEKEAKKVDKKNKDFSSYINGPEIFKKMRQFNIKTDKNTNRQKKVDQRSSPCLRSRRQLNPSRIDIQKINIGTHYQMFGLNVKEISQQFKTQRVVFTKPNNSRSAYRPYSYTKNKINNFNSGKQIGIDQKRGSIYSDQSLILPRVVRQEEKNYHRYRILQSGADIAHHSSQKPIIPSFRIDLSYRTSEPPYNPKQMSKEKLLLRQISLGEKIHSRADKLKKAKHQQ